MTQLHTSSMHRVLGIPELLDIVFRFLDGVSNLSNALVCKQWSEIALDTLWRDVSDLHRLFGLLAPLQLTSDGDCIFSRPLESSDWIRFERYSRRVRRLSYQAMDAMHVLHGSVFDEIARTRTSLNILPSLHTLNWNASPSFCVMFMHSNVKCFIARLPHSFRAISPRPFFQDVLVRMPNLTHLDLRANIPMRSIENDAIDLFLGLRKLYKVTLPRFHFTTRIAEALSRLENLGVIEFQYVQIQGRGDPADTVDFSPSLSEGAFLSLWDLSMTIGFEDAARFIDTSFAPTNLTMLYIDSLVFESPANVHELLSTISKNCQLLKSLALISLVDASAISVDQPPKDECINIDTLKPLLNCPNLNALELVHQHPLDLRQEDLEEIALKWPSLETLLLNNEPAYIHHSDLTLQAFLPFSRHCPNLRHLGLFIHASTADLPPLDRASALPYQYTSFAKLKRLSMGVSIIAEEGPVALFLSQICPLSCQLDSGVTWEESIVVEEETAKAIQSRCKKWDKVVELLPLLTKLRMEERDKTRMLQSEVEELRMRTGVLMDAGAVLQHGGVDTCVMI